MENIIWGLPTAGRTRKEEQFNVPVLTMSALLKDGANRKFSFNKAAISALNLIGKESYIQVGFRGTELLVNNAGVVERDEDGAPLAGQIIPNNSFLLAGNNSFSDKKTFEFIIKLKELDTQVENHLHLEQVEGQSYFTVSKITSNHSSGDQLLEEVITVDEVGQQEDLTLCAAPEEEVDEIISEIPGVTANEEVVDLDAEEDEDWGNAGMVEVKPVVEKAIIKPVVKKASPVTKAEPKPTAVKFAIDNTEDDGFSDSPVVNAPESKDDGFGDVSTAIVEDEEVW